MRLNFISLYTT